MIDILLQQLKQYYAHKYPYYPENVSDRMAMVTSEKIAKECEPLLEAFLNGEENDFRYGEFSILGIMEGTGCDYLTAITLLSGYIKEPVSGKKAILFYR